MYGGMGYGGMGYGGMGYSGGYNMMHRQGQQPGAEDQAQ